MNRTTSENQENVNRLLWHQKQKEIECYKDTLKEITEYLQGSCPTVWDGLLCWPSLSRGSNYSQPCPDYVNGINPNGSASKYCTEEGNWYVHPEKNNTWTDYTQCYNSTRPAQPQFNDTTIQDWIPVIKKISQVGYGISFVTLLLAFFILVSIKKLRCPRNTLHIHLFLSFMFRAFISLLKDALFIEGIGLSASLQQGDQELIFKHHQSNWECKLVTSFWQYFVVANYTWILMEGLYLHNLIFLAPFSDSSAITLYVLLGWGCPLVVVSSWVGTRAMLEDTYCWTTHTNKYLYLIIRIPIIISIVLNFCFFLNIVRVLLLKLQSAVSIETRKYRKWAKSTLVLVPLFGVHYMLFLWMSTYEGKIPVIEVIWLVCDQFFASFQGFFVSILYCLINGEVRSELNKKWRNWRSEADSKNVWVPLNQISSKFYHRSTHDDLMAHNGSRADILPHSHQIRPHNTTIGRNCCGGGNRSSKEGSYREHAKSISGGPNGPQTSPTHLTQIEEHNFLQSPKISGNGKTNFQELPRAESLSSPLLSSSLPQSYHEISLLSPIGGGSPGKNSNQYYDELQSNNMTNTLKNVSIDISLDMTSSSPCPTPCASIISTNLT